MRNPVRRSKKIGLTQGGRVKDGRADPKWSKAFGTSTWKRLCEDREELIVVRENPSRDFFHPCTAANIRSVLERLPAEDTKNLGAVVMRRTPKDDIDRVEARKIWGCIILNAFPRNMRMRWGKDPGGSTRKHMKPWCDLWESRSGEWTLQWTRPQLKRYYLYHLLLHELGHINQPNFHAARRREEFAENYALEWARKLGEF